MTFRTGIAAAMTLLLASAFAAGQDDVEARLQRALDEIEILKGRISQMQSSGGTMTAAQQSSLDAAIERALEEKIERNFIDGKLTKSGNPIQFYGFLRLDAYYNTARANSVITPAFVLPENDIAADDNDDEFAFDARLTRIGMNVDAGEIVGSEVTGKLEVDFANFTGTPESRPSPRIRLAYINMDFGSHWLRFGQDWDIISPLYPSVNAELLMWNAGNLGDRRPGAKFGLTTGGGEDVEISIVGGLLMSGAVGATDLDLIAAGPFTSTTVDGFDSGLPMVQARLGVKTDALDFGLWGHYAVYETDHSFPIGLGGTTHHKAYSVGVDLLVNLGDTLSLAGEAWLGENLRDVRGGIGQAINPVTGRGVESAGGWGEVRVQASDIVRVSLGASLDDPRNDTIAPGGARRNWTAYVGTLHDWGGGFRTGFDVIYWETDWRPGGVSGGGVGNMMRFNAYTQLNF